MNPTPRPFRWFVVALLFALAALNYLDRQTLSVLWPELQRSFGYTPVQYSYVICAFLAAYTLGYVFCGRLIDRWGVRVAVAASLAVWSLAGLSHALVSTWVGLACCRFALGLGESFNAPCGMKAVAEWVPERQRALSMAIFSNGYIVGSILAPPLVTLVALRFGWKWGFVTTGSLGFLYLAVWLLVYRDRGAPPVAPTVSTPGPTFWQALAEPACLAFVLARFLTDSLSYFLSFWLPAYLHSAHGFTLAKIGIYGWIPFVASTIGGPGGGALSDWLVRRGVPPIVARQRMLLGAACVMPLALVAVRVDSAGWAIGLIALLLGAQSCWLSNLMTSMAEIFPLRSLGTYAAVAGMGGSLGGMITNLLAGQVIHAVGYGPVFTTLGFLHLAAFAILRRRALRRAPAAIAVAG